MSLRSSFRLRRIVVTAPQYVESLLTGRVPISDGRLEDGVVRSLVRNPLTWMVIAELVVVTALILVAWSTVASVVRPALAFPSPSAASVATTGDAASPLPDLTAGVQPAGRGPAPGLNVESAFWRSRLDTLNRDQVGFEQLEWHLTRTALDAAQRYLETVVLPSIQSAERPGG
jgi:hypothetical protein